MTGHEPMDKQYDPSLVEGPIYDQWLRSGAFAAKPDGRPHAETFAMVIPPPNVTGALHLGHALNNTLQDILVRYHRMRGFNTLWQPGTDHAGIATQAVVEKRIRDKEGLTRHEVGREGLVQRIWEWKDEYEKRIISQLQLMGCSCDWDRTRFTLDDGLAGAVRTQFFKMFRAGLIFRGKRLVNWDTELQTAVANDEVYYETVQGSFWHFKYPIIDPKGDEPEHVVIATTRPETMLGDTAVAVSPDPAGVFDKNEAKLRDDLATATDKDRPTIEKKLEDLAERRETHLPLLTRLAAMAQDGRKLRLPLVDREIPLITDPWANPLVGTGCVKITPAHDPNDYEVWQRHQEIGAINVMTPDGKIADLYRPWEPNCGGNDASRPKPYDVSAELAGLDFTGTGRAAVVEKMEKLGLLADIADHEHEQGFSDRSHVPIQPFLSDQWFVQTKPISKDSHHDRRANLDLSSCAGGSHESSTDDQPTPEPQALACAAHDDQIDPEPQASACAAPRSLDLAQGATLLTWTTYGTWLPGDRRGFVSRVPEGDAHILHNAPGEPYDSNDAGVASEGERKLKGTPVLLSPAQATVVLKIIAAACERHGIELLAVSVMRNHVHVLCQGEQHGAEMLQLVKGNTSRALGQEFELPVGSRWWTKSGSRRRIKSGADLTAAIDYVKAQRSALLQWSFDQDSGATHVIVSTAQAEACGSGAIHDVASAAQAEACGSGATHDIASSAQAEACGSGATHDIASAAQAEACGSGATHDVVSAAQAEACGSGGLEIPGGKTTAGLARGAIDAVDRGDLHIIPPRYAKSYRDWLAEERDWCISRQLWWGHRISIWTVSFSAAVFTGHRAEDSGQDSTEGEERVLDSERRLGELFGLAGFENDLHISAETWMARASNSRYVCARTVEAQAFMDHLGELYAAHGTAASSATNDTNLRQAFEEKYSKQTLDAADDLEQNGLRIHGQEEDVLDTWFSSALWPFSTLGWPEENEDLAQYYPGTVLCTSRDIITNWVARMVMFGLFSTGKVPFDHVYIHPKILDGRGETMSKSKGNGVDPVDVIHTHSADALRYTMADLCTETQDIRMPVEYACPHCGKLTDQTLAIKTEEQSRKSRGEKLSRKLQPADCHRVTCANKACGKDFATRWAEPELQQQLGLARETSDKFDIGRNFCTKLWNAARFAMMNLEGVTCRAWDISELPPEDRWILARLTQTIRRYHECLKNYQFAASVRELREFFWDALCDWYIELTKPRLAGAPEDDSAKQVLAFCLDQVLRLWHPTIPFITERIWADLNRIAPRRGLPGTVELTTDDLLVTSAFPPCEGYASLADDAMVATFEDLQTVTRGVRDLRLNCDVPPKQRVSVTVAAPQAALDRFAAQSHIVRHMAGIAELTLSPDAARPKNAASLNVGGLKIFVHDISDDDAERARTAKSLTELDNKISSTRNKLGNQKFVANAKPEVVEEERTRLAALESQHAALTAHLSELNN